MILIITTIILSPKCLVSNITSPGYVGDIRIFTEPPLNTICQIKLFR